MSEVVSALSVQHFSSNKFSFVNNWSTNGIYADKYDKIVILQFAIRNGTVAQNIHMCTLPIECRPKYELLAPITNLNQGIGYARLHTDGKVTLELFPSGDNSYFANVIYVIE